MSKSKGQKFWLWVGTFVVDGQLNLMLVLYTILCDYIIHFFRARFYPY